MSRPTSSSSAARTIDPRQHTKLNIKLGQTLLGESEGFCSIAFNHKPSQTGSKRDTSITKTADGYNLSIQDVEHEQVNDFQYKGNNSTKAGSYVLTLDADGHTLVLDKLESEYAFNLAAAPWEKDAEKLAQQYGQATRDQLKTDDEGIGGSSDEGELFKDDSEEPDPSNPFDYRHYLKAATKQPDQPRNSVNKSTPLLAPSRAAPTIKASTAPRPSARPPQSRPRQSQALRAPPPHVRLERRASEKRYSPAASEDVAAEDDDDDGLVIDMGDGYQPRKKQKSMLLTPQAPGRPISLRSAAASASPAQSVLSPALPEPGSGYEEDDEEVEGEEEEEDEEDDDEVFRIAVLEADEDVEDLALGSPAVVGGASEIPRRQSTWDASTEADLQAELERALGADDDEEMPEPVVQESEEESEEE